jgi:hypothetical protein
MTALSMDVLRSVVDRGGRRVRLRRSGTVEGGCRKVSDGIVFEEAAIVLHDGVAPILEADVDGYAVEDLAILAEDIRLGAFADDCRGRQHKHLVKLLDADAQAGLLPRAVGPQAEGSFVAFVLPVRIDERDVERERGAVGVEGIGDVADREFLLDRLPVAARLLSPRP